MRLSVATAATCLCIAGFTMANEVHASIRRPTNIPAEGLDPALRTLAKDRNFQIVFVTEEVEKLHTRGAEGMFTPEEALRQLLSGTGFTFRYLDENTVTIVRSSAEQSREVRLSSGMVAVAAWTDAPMRESAPFASDMSATGSTGTLEEVVVTAQKRTESVQNVPVAVTVLPMEELTRQGVQTITDLANMSASLEFTAGSPGGGAFIRGIGTESLGGETATPSVGLVLDGVSLGNTSISDIFDMSRVEILKGPQGTLFGSSVSGGVINITTNPPDPSKMSATLNAEYGSPDLGSQYSRRSLRAVANLPLTESSALRFAFHSDDSANVYHNTFTGLDSDEPDIGMRVRYLWNVSEDFKVNIIADYNDDRRTGIPVSIYREVPPGTALAISLADCGVTAGSHNFNICSQYVERRQLLDRGISAQLDWMLGRNTLTSISSYRRHDDGVFSDYIEIPGAIMQNNFGPGASPGCPSATCFPITGLIGGLPNATNWARNTQYSEELRLASPQNHHLEWLVGVYYQHYKLTNPAPGSITVDFGPPATTDIYSYAEAHSQDYAGFANLTYYINDSTRVVAGARYTHSTIEESKYDPYNTGNQNTYSLSASASKPTFRVGVQQDLSAHSMAYATLSTGFKAPQIDDNLANGQVMTAINPELPTVAELGIKYSAFGERLAIDADIFYDRVKDFQGQVTFINQTGFVSQPANVPRVNTKGIELDIFGRPLQGLTLNLSGILNPATYPAGYLGQDGTDLSGKQLNYASKMKVTFSAQQSIPMTGTFSFVIGADAAYRSSQSMYLSALPAYTVRAGTIVNARFGLQSSNNWSVYAFGRNIGQTAFPRLLLATGIVPNSYVQTFDNDSVRLVGLQLEAKF